MIIEKTLTVYFKTEISDEDYEPTPDKEFETGFKEIIADHLPKGTFVYVRVTDNRENGLLTGDY